MDGAEEKYHVMSNNIFHNQIRTQQKHSDNHLMGTTLMTGEVQCDSTGLRLGNFLGPSSFVALC